MHADSHETRESETCPRQAHAVAVERCLAALLQAEPDWPVDLIGVVRLRDLPDGPLTEALLRRRAAIGLANQPYAPVLVDHAGRRFHPDVVPPALWQVVA